MPATIFWRRSLLIEYPFCGANRCPSGFKNRRICSLSANFLISRILGIKLARTDSIFRFSPIVPEVFSEIKVFSGIFRFFSLLLAIFHFVNFTIFSFMRIGSDSFFIFEKKNLSFFLLSSFRMPGRKISHFSFLAPASFLLFDRHGKTILKDEIKELAWFLLVYFMIVCPKCVCGSRPNRSLAPL